MSTPLTWADILQGTASFALFVDVPDAPRGPFTHWALFNFSAKTSALAEGIPAFELLEHGVFAGQPGSVD